MNSLIQSFLPWLLFASAIWASIRAEECPMSVTDPEREVCEKYLIDSGARFRKAEEKIATYHNVMCADVMRVRCRATLYLKTKVKNGTKVVKIRIFYRSRYLHWPWSYYLYTTPDTAKKILGYQTSDSSHYTTYN